MKLSFGSCLFMVLSSWVPGSVMDMWGGKAVFPQIFLWGTLPVLWGTSGWNIVLETTNREGTCRRKDRKMK